MDESEQVGDAGLGRGAAAGSLVSFSHRQRPAAASMTDVVRAVLRPSAANLAMDVDYWAAERWAARR
jgi:hypothetical protein